MLQPRRLEFFYMRPPPLAPGLYRLLVAFPGSTLWLLTAPAKAPQYVPDVAYVVFYSEMSPDYLGYSLQGPQLCPIAVRQGPSLKQLHQPPAIAVSQLRLRARMGFRP